MNIGFVDEHDGTFWFRGDELLDGGVRRQRPSGIVRGADVEETGVRGRVEHGFDVVRVRFCQRSFDSACAGNIGGAHTCFVAGIGGDVALVGQVNESTE